ncbi:MAG: hypothetical protein IPM46_02995 [Flavobacteriales bacterium]|nr:hypothetical protein [Flavobacteriales bacterium]
MAVLLWLAFYAIRIAPEPLHGFMLAWFAMITIVLHLWQEHAMVADPKGFVRRFMAGLMLKMLLSLTVLVVLLLRAPTETVMPSGITFALLYLAFLAFSTVRLSALSRQLPKA